MKLNGRVGALYSIYYKGGVLGEEPTDDHSQEPLKVALGMGQLPNGLEEVLCQMEPGEERKVVLTPDEAFGVYAESNTEVYPRLMFDFGDDIAVGDVIMWDNEKMGTKVPVRVIEATDDAVRLDYNHPFAGKTLEYWVKVESISGLIS